VTIGETTMKIYKWVPISSSEQVGFLLMKLKVVIVQQAICHCFCVWSNFHIKFQYIILTNVASVKCMLWTRLLFCASLWSMWSHMMNITFCFMFS